MYFCLFVHWCGCTHQRTMTSCTCAVLGVPSQKTSHVPVAQAPSPEYQHHSGIGIHMMFLWSAPSPASVHCLSLCCVQCTSWRRTTTPGGSITTRTGATIRHAAGGEENSRFGGEGGGFTAVVNHANYQVLCGVSSGPARCAPHPRPSSTSCFAAWMHGCSP